MDKIVYKMVQLVDIQCYFTDSFQLLLFIEFVPILSFLGLFLILLCEVPVYELIGVGSYVLDCSATSELNLLSVFTINFHFDDIVFISYIRSTTILWMGRIIIFFVTW